LIDRTLHSSDARTVIVTLTRTGNQLYAEMADEMAQLQKELFAGVTTAGVSRLFQTFDVLEKRLRQSTTDSSQ
jgi:DNA-binding MarR family transcriptional regulator